MIGYEEIRALTSRAARLYPPGDDAANAAWWGERGVDAEGLRRFCMEDALDSVQSVMPIVGEQSAASREQLLTGALAMSAEVGFLLGFLIGSREVSR